MDKAGPIPNPIVSPGLSLTPPGLTGDLLSGVLAVWSGQDGQVQAGSDQDSPPFKPYVVNPAWKTFATPAVVLDPDSGRVYIAWSDPGGDVFLGSSVDGFKAAIPISRNGSDGQGPALAVGDGFVYVAWRGTQDFLCRASVDFDFKVQVVDEDDNTIIFSRPSLTYASGKLFALAGGTPTESNPLDMVVFASGDQGQSFTQLAVPPLATWGPPALAVVEDLYYLTWADAAQSLLHTAATKDLTQPLSPTDYTDGCHEGGPALIGLQDHLMVGWSYGASPTDPRSHHVTFATLPVQSATSIDEARRQAYERRQARARLRAPAHPCDPLSVWDPVEEKCVPKGGCWGACVLSSITGVPPFGPVFNPFKYALCVIACKSSS